LTDTSNVAVRGLAIAINDMCRDRIEEGMPPEDVAVAVTRTLAHIVVEHDLGGTTAQKALAGFLTIARARKETKAKVEAGQ
jgi:hypothetical protein